MAGIESLQDPMVRDQLVRSLQTGSYVPGAQVFDPKTGAVSAAPGASGGNSQTPDEFERIATDYYEGLKTRGERSVAENAKQRGILRSGETIRMDQVVESEARSQAMLELSKLRLSAEQLAITAKEQREASAVRAAGLGTQIKEQEEASGVRARGQILAEGEAVGEVGGKKTVTVQGLETQKELATLSAATQTSIASANNTTQVVIANIEKAMRAGDNETAKSIATANNISAQALAKIQQDIATAGNISAERIAGGQQTTALETAKLSTETQKAIAAANNTTQLAIADIEKAMRSGDNETAKSIATANNISAQSLAKIQQEIATAGQASAEKIASAGVQSAEKIAGWQYAVSMKDIEEKTNARTEANSILRSQLAGIVRSPETEQYVSTLEAKIAQNDNDVRKMQVAQQAMGFDLSTETGKSGYQTYLKTLNLTAQDQKEITKWTLSAQSGGFDLSTQTGRDSYRTWLDTQKSQYNLSAEDQKEITVAQIAAQASGYDLTTAQGMKDYTTFIKENAATYNLSAEDQRQQFSWNYYQRAKEFDITTENGMNQFLSQLKEGARQFNISQTDQMAITRATLVNNTNLAKMGLNGQAMANIVDLLSSATGSSWLSQQEGGDMDKLVDRIVDANFTSHNVYGIPLPESAIVRTDGVSAADRAAFLLTEQSPEAIARHTDYFKKSNGATRGSANYNATYDFDRNGIVDFDDYFTFSAMIGQGGV